MDNLDKKQLAHKRAIQGNITKMYPNVVKNLQKAVEDENREDILNKGGKTDSNISFPHHKETHVGIHSVKNHEGIEHKMEVNQHRNNKSYTISGGSIPEGHKLQFDKHSEAKQWAKGKPHYISGHIIKDSEGSVSQQIQHGSKTLRYPKNWTGNRGYNDYNRDNSNLRGWKAAKNSSLSKAWEDHLKTNLEKAGEHPFIAHLKANLKPGDHIEGTHTGQENLKGKGAANYRGTFTHMEGDNVHIKDAWGSKRKDNESEGGKLVKHISSVTTHLSEPHKPVVNANDSTFRKKDFSNKSSLSKAWEDHLKTNLKVGDKIKTTSGSKGKIIGFGGNKNDPSYQTKGPSVDIIGKTKGAPIKSPFGVNREDIKTHKQKVEGGGSVKFKKKNFEKAGGMEEKMDLIKKK